MSSTTEWNPEELGDTVVVLANQPLRDRAAFSRLWESAKLRVSVDGGSNHLSGEPDLSKPHIVSGDFDSIDEKVLRLYRQDEDVRVVETPDQDKTDLTKALEIVAKEEKVAKEIKPDCVVVFVENGGRLDQLFGVVETLFHARDIFKDLHKVPRVVQSSSHGLSWLLCKGSHAIVTPKENPDKYYVGLIPIGSPAKVKTTGLKWDVDGVLEFGKLVSTSNAFQAGSAKVTVETDSPLLWIVEKSF